MTIQDFIIALNQKFNSEGYTFSAERRNGAKYFRVTQSFKGNGRSMFCFIDSDGAIYKPASYRAPAKGIRSTLATVDIARIDSCGGWLYANR